MRLTLCGLTPSKAATKEGTVTADSIETTKSSYTTPFHIVFSANKEWPGNFCHDKYQMMQEMMYFGEQHKKYDKAPYWKVQISLTSGPVNPLKCSPLKQPNQPFHQLHHQLKTIFQFFFSHCIKDKESPPPNPNAWRCSTVHWLMHCLPVKLQLVSGGTSFMPTQLALTTASSANRVQGAQLEDDWFLFLSAAGRPPPHIGLKLRQNQEGNKTRITFQHVTSIGFFL